MRDVLRLFGVLSGLGGVIVAAILVGVPFVNGERIGWAVTLPALAWLLGGLFWAALCVTIAQVHETVTSLRAEVAELRGERVTSPEPRSVPRPAVR